MLDELTKSLMKAVNNYENISLTGDLNTYALTHTKSEDIPNHLMDLSNLFVLSNLANIKNSPKNMFDTSLDIMLTNKHRTLYSTSTAIAGLSDCLNLILSC